eukprot:6468092-Amphidinium_carterae.1
MSSGCLWIGLNEGGCFRAATVLSKMPAAYSAKNRHRLSSSICRLLEILLWLMITSCTWQSLTNGGIAGVSSGN